MAVRARPLQVHPCHSGQPFVLLSFCPFFLFFFYPYVLLSFCPLCPFAPFVLLSFCPFVFFSFYPFVIHQTSPIPKEYHTIPYHTIPYHTIPNHTIPYLWYWIVVANGDSAYRGAKPLRSIAMDLWQVRAPSGKFRIKIRADTALTHGPPNPKYAL